MSGTISRRGMLAMPAILLLPAGQAFAQAPGWRPTKLVRIITAQAAGGTTDVMARLIGPYLQARWGQPVVVENKPGAGGVIGTQEAVVAAPDGHTILMGNVGAQSITFSLARSLPYKYEDMIPVSNLINGPSALIVNKELPVNNLTEFIDHLKNNPGKVNFGTPGLGTTPHLAGVWFNTLMGTQSSAVHYRGSAPAMTDLLAGVVQYSFDALVNARSQIKGNTVKAFGVTGAAKFPGMPELPALREVRPELKTFVSESWVGLFLQKGTPPEILNALNEEAKLFLAQPEIPPRFIELGGVANYQTVEQYGKFVKAEADKWAEVVRSANLKIDL